MPSLCFVQLRMKMQKARIGTTQDMRGILSLSSQSNILSLLKTSTETRDLNLGRTIHARLIRHVEPNLIHSNYLINLYGKCGQLSIARSIFDKMPQRNVVSSSALMASYFHSGFSWEALTLFKMMVSGEPYMRPNQYVYATVLAACCDIHAHEVGQQCHAHLFKSGFMLHTFVHNALLHMYTRCSGMKDALSVFHAMPVFDIFSFNSIINGFRDNGCLREAMNALSHMVKEVALWDHVTHVGVLGLCADLKHLKLGRQVHSQILKCGLEYSVFVGSAIVDMYGKCGDVKGALYAFSALRDKNVVSWTAILAVCSQNGYFEESLNFLMQMGASGVKPNEFTYAVALNSCAGLSALRNGDALHAQTEKSGHKMYLVVGNALINMYSKSGSIEDAHMVFTGMPQRDIISWNSIITGYSHHGLGSEALELFHDMLIEEVPSSVTFVGVLLACGHLGLVEEGFYYLNHFMRNLGIKPELEHFTCMVGLLCRAGLLDQAEKFMRDTCVEWDIVAWRTLLSACEVHRNFSLGKRVAEHILQLDPNDTGTYILLSNIYAKASRWDGVAKIRKLMKRRDVKKEPGVSWIQVRNETHVFASEDEQHPWMSEIREKITEIIAEIKLIGYVPDIAGVLHDVADEQKEDYLSYHSEKLAIAFGLLVLPFGAPIHVMKNLRVCRDCHAAIKLISNITRRKIIVRDANRFHCFTNGACSCDDYW